MDASFGNDLAKPVQLKNRGMDLRLRLLLLGLFTLIPAFGFVLYATLEQRRDAEDRARLDAQRLLQFAALQQKQMVSDAHRQLLTLTQLPIVRDRSLAGACNRTFARLRGQNRHYNNLGVADPRGRIYCSGAPLKTPVNIADRDYFRAAVATRDFSISDYQIGRVVNKSVVAFGQPVLDDAGALQGVAFVSIDLMAWFKDVAAGTPLPPDASLSLVNDRGTILARHPDPEQWMGKTLPDRPLLAAMAEGHQTGRVEDLGIDGVRRLYVFTPVHTSSAGRVYLVAGIPSAELYTSVNRAFLGGLAGMLLVAALAGVTAWFGGSRLILAPVRTLTEAARRLGAGDLQARTRLPHGDDELGRLAHTFDAMAETLERRDAALRAAEAERRASETRLANVVNNAADAIISVDEEQRIVTFNRTAEQIFGYALTDVLGKPLDLLLPENAVPAHRGHVHAFGRETGTTRVMGGGREVSGRRADGAVFPVEASISRVSESGRTVFTAILRDVTERRRMLRALHEKDELLSTVGAMARVGGWEFDPRTRKGSWTDEVARIHDLDPKDETGVDRGLSFFHGEHREKIEAAIKDAVEHARPYDLELEMITARGNRKWVRTIGQPVLEDGKVIKVWGSFQDITERKNAENEIRALNTDLERRVAERTAELEAANKELEAFSYSVSHDLRAPLRSIDGFSQALLEDYADKLDRPGQHHLQRVCASAQRMGALIDDMLGLSRVTRAPMQRTPVDLSALAESVIAELREAHPERTVEVVIEPGLVADADAKLVRVLLANLLGNAWKFTGKTNGARVEFGANGTGDGPEYFVRDNGAGFDMQYAHKLFGAFQRLHGMEEFPGTGIGLATVQRIARRHGGSVRAEGRPGAGAAFYFALRHCPTDGGDRS